MSVILYKNNCKVLDPYFF